MSSLTKSLTVLLLLVCGTAPAAEWVVIGSSADKSAQINVDTTSIRVVGQIRRAWFKVLSAPHTRKGVPPDDGKWLSYYLSRIAFNCADELSRQEALIAHFEDESVQSYPPAGFPTPWEPVSPESIARAQMEFICKWRPK